MNEKPSVDRLRTDVQRLASSPRHSRENPAEHRAAAEFIAEELQEAGCEIEFREFDIPGQSSPRVGRNVVGRMGAETRQGRLVIGAHYDTVPGSPGADDNASGVAAMLECARLLAGLTPQRPILFAAFDAEEKQPPVEGLHGSTAFVRASPRSPLPRGEGEGEGERKFIEHGGFRISAAVILECVGYSSPPGTQRFPAGFQLLFPRAFDVARRSRFAGDSLAVLSNRNSRLLSRRFEASSQSAELPTLPVELPGWMRVPYNLRRSDHAPFWQAGIPAIMVGDTANFRNPNYHLPSDTPDTIDYVMVARVAQALVELVSV